MASSAPDPRSPRSPALALERVNKSFGAQVILREISLEIPHGQTVVVMGSSGRGKTVLLKHLIGLVQPDSGRVRIEGEDLWASSPFRQNELRRRFGMAFQEGALFDSMSVFDNVAFPLRRHARLHGPELERRVARCLERVHLEQAMTKRPSELSTGMRRRVGFARAIALEPKLLLFDEPTAGLDPAMVRSIDHLIRELAQASETTTVVTTHDLRTAATVADRVVLLGEGGRLVADAPRAEFFDLPNPAVRELVTQGLAGLPLPRSGQEGMAQR